MSRTDARECGFKMIYESFFNNEIDVERFFNETVIDDEFSPKGLPTNEEKFDDMLIIDNENKMAKLLTDEEKQFAKDIYENYEKNKAEIANKFQENLKKNLRVSDVYLLDRAIIYTAIVQIDKLQESAGLVINEAVRMAKKYSTDKSPRFINGVLASVYNE